MFSKYWCPITQITKSHPLWGVYPVFYLLHIKNTKLYEHIHCQRLSFFFNRLFGPFGVWHKYFYNFVPSPKPVLTITLHPNSRYRGHISAQFYQGYQYHKNYIKLFSSYKKINHSLIHQIIGTRNDIYLYGLHVTHVNYVQITMRHIFYHLFCTYVSIFYSEIMSNEKSVIPTIPIILLKWLFSYSRYHLSILVPSSPLNCPNNWLPICISLPSIWASYLETKMCKSEIPLTIKMFNLQNII